MIILGMIAFSFIAFMLGFLVGRIADLPEELERREDEADY